MVGKDVIIELFEAIQTIQAYSQLGYPKGLSIEKRATKDYFGFL